MNNKNFKTPFEWQRFLLGRWQREMPSRPGRYPVADRAGNHSGYVTIVLNKGKAESVQFWDGWWWSEAEPYLPRPVDPWNG
jgi:hypothetical protein